VSSKTKKKRKENNGIGGFHENRETLRGTNLPGFSRAPKMRLKNADSGYNKKAGKSVPVASKRKMADNFHRIDGYWPKIGLNPNFLRSSTAY